MGTIEAYWATILDKDVGRDPTHHLCAFLSLTKEAALQKGDIWDVGYSYRVKSRWSAKRVVDGLKLRRPNGRAESAAIYHLTRTE